MAGSSVIPELLARHERELIHEWLQEVRAAGLNRDADLAENGARLVKLLRDATSAGEVTNVRGAAYSPLRTFLDELSRAHARQGFTPRETATFVFSFKRPLFARLRAQFEH